VYYVKNENITETAIIKLYILSSINIHSSMNFVLFSGKLESLFGAE